MTTARADRRRPPALVRSALLVTAAVLALGAGTTACEGGVALCLDDNSCTLSIRTGSDDGSKTVKVFGGEHPLEMTVGHVTDGTAEVKIGDDRKTVDKGKEGTVGGVKVILRKSDKEDHFAELHVSR
ncbi:hypothetical protein [Kitasatospora sp. NPDC101183]|uniref:hypothetical protein n=1 Tax=Kitasatospora sp. NPDC101183 TaxID=3364100 RepID=UPI0037F58278